ncbi:IS66-like element accessory protein TnpA [Rhizobium beringeri]
MTLTGVGPSRSLRVTKILRNGKRRFDPVEKERLIDAALEPGGLSIAGLALAHGINANQLRNWVKLRRERPAGRKLTSMANSVPPALFRWLRQPRFVRSPAPSARPTSPRVRLKATLPNGVQLELEDADAQVLSAMIEALGRCDVPAG